MRGMDTVGYDVDGVAVEVRRSAKRRRTVSAYRAGRRDRRGPRARPGCSRAEEREWVTTMLARLDKQDRRRRPSDDKLMERAPAALARATSRAGPGRPASAGSTTSASAGARAPRPTGPSGCPSRLQGMPAYVVECVLLHELAHLLVHDHSAAFWGLADRHPRAERAKGYLEGHAQAQRWPDPTAVDGDDADGAGRRTPRWRRSDLAEPGPSRAGPALLATARRWAGRRPATSARRTTPR